MTIPLSLRFWRGATTIFSPLIELLLHQRARRGKEDLARLSERRGLATHRRPKGPLIWLHGASVGEAMSVLALIKKLQAIHPQLRILMTTGTVASARILVDRLPTGVLHQFAPVDRLPWIERFLNHWQPDLALWIESELWPNTIDAIARRSIPLIMVNGRMSEKSYRRWQRQRSLIHFLLQRFDLCLAQDEAQAQRLRNLGATQVVCEGNLKAGAAPLPVDAQDLASLKEQIAGRPVWLAASTHIGEEDLVATAHRQLRINFPHIVTMIAPRHPIRGDEIAASLKAKGLTVAQRSHGDILNPQHDIYLADTLGEMGLFYRLAGVTFLGGSLVPIGGHNPIEAAQLDTAIIVGPFTFNFSGLTEELRRKGALSDIQNATDLAQAVHQLLADKTLRSDRIVRAHLVAQREASALDRIVTRITPFLSSLNQDSEARLQDNRRAHA
ncbi:MAG: 3-deoxy-D-manno-octulosonic acid transferase [Alphaproteobacteria bacterium]